MSIWRTKLVPISGKERVPVLQSISSAVTPKGSGDVKSLMTSSSLVETSITGIPVNSSRYL